MYHIRKDTLAYHKARPFMVKRDFSKVPLPVVVSSLNNYCAKNGMIPVEAGAIQFYFLNHVWAEVAKATDPNIPLHEDLAALAENYVNSASLAAERLAYYILMITVREMRHIRNGGLTGLLAPMGEQMQVFIQNNQDHGEDGAVGNLKKKPPAINVGPFMTNLVTLFSKGSFHGSYGGKPWAQIAECLRAYVYGETTAEMMVDTAWTLAHNNGPMFNKGMLYANYTPVIYKILDVQRSGQIPQLIEDGVMATKQDYIRQCLNETIITQLQMAKKHLPQLFTGYVDWFLVEAMGAVHTYTQEKHAQVQKYGKSAKALETEAKAAKAAADKVAQAKAEEAKKFYILGDHEYAMITERKAA